MEARSLVLSLTLVLLVISNPAWAADKTGSADYPEVGRFAGSEISFYEVENYGQTVLATGPVKSARDAATTALTVEGKITRIVYKVPRGISALEVFRNFENRIQDAGYSVIFSGGPDQISDYDFKYKHPVEVLEETSMSGEIHYLSAKKTSGSSETYLALLVSPHSGGDGQRVRLIAAETKAMEDQMIDADAMQSAIAESGRVALYGIYFDTDSAQIKTESKPTLDEIAKLMKRSPELEIIVVGHTDYTGGYDHNMDLSRRRAEAVVTALVGEHKISAGRLKSAGVGYLAPAATNESDAGRALNRRVELVKDN